MRRRFVLPAGALDPLPRAEEPAPELALPAEIARHLEVLRLGLGAEIELTDGAGVEAVVRIARVEKRRVAVRIVSARRAPPDPEPGIVLLQGVGKGDKLDHVTRAAAELGVERLVPVLTARAVAQRLGKIDRLRALADDGLRVARGAWRMAVDEPRALDAALRLEAEARLALLVGAEHGLRTALEGRPRPHRIALLVGPEGGFSDAEEERIRAAGFEAVHLGPRVLRTETAGPAVVAMVRYAYG